MPSTRGARFPDMYDPDQPLHKAAPRPLWYIKGLGGFAAVDGTVQRPSKGLSHLVGEPVTEVVRQAHAGGYEVYHVVPGTKDWHQR